MSRKYAVRLPKVFLWIICTQLEESVSVYIWVLGGLPRVPVIGGSGLCPKMHAGQSFPSSHVMASAFAIRCVCAGSVLPEVTVCKLPKIGKGRAHPFAVGACPEKHGFRVPVCEGIDEDASSKLKPVPAPLRVDPLPACMPTVKTWSCNQSGRYPAFRSKCRPSGAGAAPFGSHPQLFQAACG